MTDTKPVVMYDSPEAASWKTVEGWVSSNGQFWAENEHMARWTGCTHQKCGSCDTAVPVPGDVFCDPCTKAREEAALAAAERQTWDGEPLYLPIREKYFFTIDQVMAYVRNNGLCISDLTFIICEPVYAGQFDPEDFFHDEMAPDGDLPDEILAAAEILNQTIAAAGPLSWVPGPCVAMITPEAIRKWVFAAMTVAERTIAIRNLATRVFGSETKAVRWMGKRHPKFGVSPLKLMETQGGFDGIEEWLGQTDAGVYT